MGGTVMENHLALFLSLTPVVRLSATLYTTTPEFLLGSVAPAAVGFAQRGGNVAVSTKLGEFYLYTSERSGVGGWQRARGNKNNNMPKSFPSLTSNPTPFSLSLSLHRPPSATQSSRAGCAPAPSPLRLCGWVSSGMWVWVRDGGVSNYRIKPTQQNVCVSQQAAVIERRCKKAGRSAPSVSGPIKVMSSPKQCVVFVPLSLVILLTLPPPHFFPPTKNRACWRRTSRWPA